MAEALIALLEAAFLNPKPPIDQSPAKRLARSRSETPIGKVETQSIRGTFFSEEGDNLLRSGQFAKTA
jgi:hypothetical protein